ncbi:oxygen-independent coproporphyrinogen-3 oxidase [Flexibacter flexilis DSM 6793]|uniref:Heme chaperone HemW n=1 Tax=Flexibacter flexilis DSM 6793 TaxID=927664 RepID=A0A1I1ITB0_9BACT|nr:radical SAM family heme chaperone HemW [Flexibacter flexilis]SFC39435.1 oxygen-independent coproporphyrinogen-3 oxidase [Flexibacter flexilis DSM 6793]
MAGIYLHIPFCKQACYYCDFHFSTNTQLKADLVAAMRQELQLQKNYLQGQTIETIYFGGGTPSLLSQAELDSLLETIYQHFSVTAQPEISLEANPDDLNLEKIRSLQATGINRLSIGIQTFNNENLTYLHRAHNATQASLCVQQAQDTGISNISIDLIYAIPHPDTTRIWEQDLATAIGLGVPHISSYCLTIESRTAFGNWLKNGKIKPIDEDTAALHFEMLTDRLTAAGFEHYEVSNFAQPEMYSRHNTSYWQQKPYLGVGPSAHSFDLVSRQYNVANNAQYIKALQQNEIPATKEILSRADRVNEYILTTLRTQWGCDLSYLATNLDLNLAETAAQQLQQWQANGWATLSGNVLKLTTQGKLLADGLASDLFID